ncbi:MAG: 5'-methylthioadenosine/S-adenosylhomocysteine nucleosidase [Oscillibacter sp.]|nr:5'-methylthioadenosine/S-adenosylhomocysteine nucleosidase [Oscillibacter sp.]
MKIGLQVAMVPELHAIPGAKDLAPFETVSGVPFFEVEEGIIACAGGMGKVNAAMSAEILCRRFGVDLVINSGLAGCFTDLPTGTLLVADDFVQHDVDSSPLGDPVGMVSTVNCTYFPTWRPDHVAAVLKGLGVDVSRGRVATGDQFIQNGARAEWIRDTFHPVLAEMEGGAIAQVCMRNGVPFVALKSVSDHLFREGQMEEYFDYGKALESIGRALLPLAQALKGETL